jgi:hypothetical protein
MQARLTLTGQESAESRGSVSDGGLPDQGQHECGGGAFCVGEGLFGRPAEQRARREAQRAAHQRAPADVVLDRRAEREPAGTAPEPQAKPSEGGLKVLGMAWAFGALRDAVRQTRTASTILDTDITILLFWNASDRLCLGPHTTRLDPSRSVLSCGPCWNAASAGGLHLFAPSQSIPILNTDDSRGPFIRILV